MIKGITMAGRNGILIKRIHDHDIFNACIIL